jgi:hypothetical protein
VDDEITIFTGLPPVKLKPHVQEVSYVLGEGKLRQEGD